MSVVVTLDWDCDSLPPYPPDWADAGSASITVKAAGVSVVLVAAGTVFGLIASIAATRVMAGLLYDVSPLDPLVFAAVASLLAAAGFLASLIPARRATRVDPVVALRVE